MQALIGSDAQLSVSAIGLKPLKYQWSRDGEEIEGANEPLFKLSKIKSTDSGLYQVEISNNLGTVRSKNVSVSVIEPPVLEGGLDSVTVDLGGAHKYVLMVSGTEPITVDWFKNGVLMSGRNEKVLDLSPIDRNMPGNTMSVCEIRGANMSAIRLWCH